MDPTFFRHHLDPLFLPWYAQAFVLAVFVGVVVGAIRVAWRGFPAPAPRDTKTPVNPPEHLWAPLSGGAPEAPPPAPPTPVRVRPLEAAAPPDLGVLFGGPGITSGPPPAVATFEPDENVIQLSPDAARPPALPSFVKLPGTKPD